MPPDLLDNWTIVYWYEQNQQRLLVNAMRCLIYCDLAVKVFCKLINIMVFGSAYYIYSTV